MLYTEHLPHPMLRSVVDCYWSMRAASGQPELTRTVFPDACTDIIFDFNNASAFVVGIMTRPIAAHVTSTIDFFGIRFRAGGMSSLISSSLREFTDEAYTMQELQYRLPDGLIDRMLPVCNNDRVEIVNKWLLKEAGINSRPSVWQWCVTKISEAHGNVSIRNIAREASISEKQLERKFLYNVGVTPKRFGTIVRFCEAKRRLGDLQTSLEEFAWDLGYNDHAHLTKSFKGFAGITPSEFLNQQTEHS